MLGAVPEGLGPIDLTSNLAGQWVGRAYGGGAGTEAHGNPLACSGAAL